MAVMRLTQWQVEFARYPELRECLAEAKRIQLKHGATSIRVWMAQLAGSSSGVHYFMQEFPDLESYARAQKALASDPDWQAWGQKYNFGMGGNAFGNIASMEMLADTEI